jgi:hypothetical protein
MKFDDYQREFYSRYHQFAETLKVILEKAIEASELPRPQSIQHRAKSLKTKFGSEIADALGELLTKGSSADADFVLAVMENYRGEPTTHEVLKRIVAKYSNDQKKLTGVSISFDNTGVVWGEFGMVDAIRRKKAAMEPWRTDQRLEVRALAETYIRQADLRIADEQRRAEARKALRELEYDDRKDGDDKRGEGDDESTWH